MRYFAAPLRGWAILSAFGLASSVGVAQAGFLTQFSGWTEMAGTGSSAGGVVDFAVYQNPVGHDWAADLGLTQVLAGANAGGGQPDLRAAYVFFYEAINTQPVAGNGAVANFNVASGDPKGYTSGGWLSGMVFKDSEGAVGPARNFYLGMEQLPTPPGDSSTSLPSHSGETLSGFAALSGTIAPTGLNSLGGDNGAGAADFLWTGLFGNQLLKAGAYSPTLFLTSDMAPTYSAGTLSGTSANHPSSGGIAAEDPVAPEPTTLILWSLSALGMAATVRRRQARTTFHIPR